MIFSQAMETVISDALDTIYQITIQQNFQYWWTNNLDRLIKNMLHLSWSANPTSNIFFLLHKNLSARQRDQRHPNEAAIFRLVVICHR